MNANNVAKLFCMFVFVVHWTSAHVVPVCGAGFVGERITHCSDEGMRCHCYGDGSVSCLDLCHPTLPPNKSCYKAEIPDEYRNITTGFGCCSEWVCSGEVLDEECAAYGQLGGYVVENCGSMDAQTCLCHHGKRNGCTTLCIKRPDYNEKACHLEEANGGNNSADECCPRQVCPWDPTLPDIEEKNTTTTADTRGPVTLAAAQFEVTTATATDLSTTGMALIFSIAIIVV